MASPSSSSTKLAPACAAALRAGVQKDLSFTPHNRPASAVVMPPGSSFGFVDRLQTAQHVGGAELDVLVAFFRRSSDAPQWAHAKPYAFGGEPRACAGERGERRVHVPEHSPSTVKAGLTGVPPPGASKERSCERPTRARRARRGAAAAAGDVERRAAARRAATPCASVAVRLTVVLSAPRVITVSCGSLPLQTASGWAPPVMFQL